MSVWYRMTGDPRRLRDIVTAADELDAYLYREHAATPQVVVEEYDSRGPPPRMLLAADGKRYDLDEIMVWRELSETDGLDPVLMEASLEAYLSMYSDKDPVIRVHTDLSSDDREMIEQYLEDVEGSPALRHFIPVIGSFGYGRDQQDRFRQRLQYFREWERDTDGFERLKRRERQVRYGLGGVLFGTVATAAVGAYTGDDAMIRTGITGFAAAAAYADLVAGQVYAQILRECRGDPDEVRSYLENLSMFSE